MTPQYMFNMIQLIEQFKFLTQNYPTWTNLNLLKLVQVIFGNEPRVICGVIFGNEAIQVQLWQKFEV